MSNIVIQLKDYFHVYKKTGFLSFLAFSPFQCRLGSDDYLTKVFFSPHILYSSL